MMTLTHVSSFLDGGTISVTLDGHIVYYIDDRLTTSTRGEVFDAYPTHGNPISSEKLWELITAVKEYPDIKWRKHILHLLGTA